MKRIGCKIEPDPEFPPLNADRIILSRLYNGNGNLPAGEETCLLTVSRQQIGLGQNLQEVLVKIIIRYKPQFVTCFPQPYVGIILS